ncbi:MAG: CoA transferase, partial [Planctomycetia bacterium]|nr:CoA transferase [Planctomycetia bacterium]
VTGQPGGAPTKAGTSIGDLTGGMFTLVGVAAALYHRERTGEGMQVDVSMLDGQLAILESAVMRYAATGQTPGPIGNRHPSITPFEAYDCADRPLIIAAGNDTLFGKLCAALQLPSLPRDERFSDNHRRTQHAPALKELLEAVLKTQAAAHWQEVIEAAGVPCALINTVADAVEHPQVQARNMVVEAGGLRMAGNPVKLSAFPDPATRQPAPALDADGERIRREFQK